MLEPFITCSVTQALRVGCQRNTAGGMQCNNSQTVGIVQPKSGTQVKVVLLSNIKNVKVVLHMIA